MAAGEARSTSPHAPCGGPRGPRDMPMYPDDSHPVAILCVPAQALRPPGSLSHCRPHPPLFLEEFQPPSVPPSCPMQQPPPIQPPPTFGSALFIYC